MGTKEYWNVRRSSDFSADVLGSVRHGATTSYLDLLWALDLHTTVEIVLSGFLTGGFLKDTGPAGNMAFSNVGITYKF